MKVVSPRPGSGCYVAVWEWNDKVWSDTYWVRGGELNQWDGEDNRWVVAVWKPWTCHKCIYIEAKGKEDG